MDKYAMSDTYKMIWKIEFKKITDKLKKIPKDKTDLNKITITVKEGHK